MKTLYSSTRAHSVAEVGEPPDVCEVDGESDDGEEEVDVGVPRHAPAVAAIAGTAAVPFGDGVIICEKNSCMSIWKRLRESCILVKLLLGKPRNLFQTVLSC